MRLCTIEKTGNSSNGSSSGGMANCLGRIAGNFIINAKMTFAMDVDLSKYSFIGVIEEGDAASHPYNITEYAITSTNEVTYRRRSHYHSEDTNADPRDTTNPLFSILIPVTDRTDIVDISVRNIDSNTPAFSGTITGYGFNSVETLGNITGTFAYNNKITLATEVDLSKYSFIGAIEEGNAKSSASNIIEYAIGTTQAHYRSHFRSEDTQDTTNPLFSILIPVADRTDIADISVRSINNNTPAFSGTITLYGFN